MNNIKLFVALVFFIFFHPTLMLAQKRTLSINLNLKGISGSQEAVLLKFNSKQADTIARKEIINGTSEINISIGNEPSFYFLKLSLAKETVPLFLGAEIVKITGDISTWPKVQVAGSISHRNYEDYHLLTDSLESTGKILSKQYTTIDTRDTALRSALEKQLGLIIQAYEKQQLEFVNSHTNSYYSPVVINNANWDWKKKRAVYEKLTPLIKTSKYGTLLAKNITKWKKSSGLLEINDTVPEFKARTSNNAELSLKKELSDNKLTLIDFWASWCGPCRMENPTLVKMYHENKNKGFDILGISLDEKDANWKAAIVKDGLVWDHVSDLQGWKSPIAKLYFAGMPFNFIPQNFLVDAKGKILARNLRGDQLSKRVAELLNGGNL